MVDSGKDDLMGVSRRRFLAGVGAAGAAAALGVVGSSVAEAAASGASGSGARPEDFDARVATSWFDLALVLVQTTPGFTPPVAARALAYAGVAVYEAVVRGSREYESLDGVLAGLGGLPRGRRNLHWPTVANEALARIARSMFATTGPANLAAIEDLRSSLADWLRVEAGRQAFRASVQRGRDVARAIAVWSRDDGGHEGQLRNFPPYAPPVGPGLWVPTPPGFQPGLQPFWGANRCLAIRDGAACPPGDHTPFSEDPGSAFYSEAVEVYDAVNNRTPEQEAIARFWSDDPGTTVTPPGHSVSIATQVLRAEDASLMTAAETYAKVGIAVADAFVACWNAKYRYNLVRPVTYIQRLIDPGWLPLLVTPPFPEYPSGHSVQSGAAFGALADLFGDDHPFDDHTHDNRGLPPRHFDSFTHAANEAAISRLYGGIHYRPAIELGVAQGRCIADTVTALPIRR
jgi:hypothetical protein